MAFDRQIILLNRVATRTNTGERVISYSEVVTTFAEKVYKRGGEQTSADQQVGFTVESFRIRYRSGITQVNAIVFENEMWQVKGIQEENRKQFLVLECEKKDDDGPFVKPAWDNLAPSLLELSEPSVTSIQLDWINNSSNAEGVKIERSTDGIIFSLIGMVVTPGSTFIDTGFNAGNYHYRIFAFQGNQITNYSNTASRIE